MHWRITNNTSHCWYPLSVESRLWSDVPHRKPEMWKCICVVTLAPLPLKSAVTWPFVQHFVPVNNRINIKVPLQGSFVKGFHQVTNRFPSQCSNIGMTSLWIPVVCTFIIFILWLFRQVRHDEVSKRPVILDQFLIGPHLWYTTVLHHNDLVRFREVRYAVGHQYTGLWGNSTESWLMLLDGDSNFDLLKHEQN